MATAVSAAIHHATLDCTRFAVNRIAGGNAKLLLHHCWAHLHRGTVWHCR